MQVDSSNTYTNQAYSNNGVSGIVSGLDTEGLVEGMLSGIQTKIDKQTAKQQQLTWKQDIYRDVIDKVNTFQDKYFSFTSDTCLKSNAIFGSMKTTSSSSAVTVKSASTSAAANTSIQVAQLASATSMRASQKVKDGIDIDVTAEKLASLADSESSSLTMNLDGITKTFDLKGLDTSSKENFLSGLSNKIQNAFGSSVYISDGKIHTGNGQNVTLSGKGTEILGVSDGESTSVKLSTKLSDMGISIGDDGYKFKLNGEEISLSADSTVKDLIDKVAKSDSGVLMSFNTSTNMFALTSKESGAGFRIDVEDTNGVGGESPLFSALKLTSSQGAVSTSGTNAVVNIDGTTLERTTNSFSYGGLSLELNSTTGKYIDDSGQLNINSNGTFVNQEGTEQKATVESKIDSDKIVKTVKSFVEDYNKLIGELNEYTHADSTYKKYDPLTAAQKKEMTDKEVELWEKKAKEGLLRNDSGISSFLTNMRTAMYTNNGTKYVLSQIGVSSSKEWKDYGKLEVDEKTLKAAVEDNPSAVSELFTSSKGLSTKLESICTTTASKSSGNPGSLVKMAGVKGYASEKNNTIYKQLQSISDKLTSLNKRYESKKTMYWKQYNGMETSLSDMNSQASWLSMFTS